MWKKNWHQYKHSRIFVQDHALYQLSIYSFSRVGEYIESNMRRGSDRGLLYKANRQSFMSLRRIRSVIAGANSASRTLTSSSSKTKKGRQRSACESQKTLKVLQTPFTKGSLFFLQSSFCGNVKCLLTNSIALRPQHEMYENIKPLFANPILFLLTIVLTDDVFRDYFNFAEIEAISSFQDESLHHLRIKKNMLQVLFFRTISVDEFTNKILDAQSFSNRTIQLNHRAEYAENIDIHDIRAEIFVKTNDKNSQDQKSFQ